VVVAGADPGRLSLLDNFAWGNPTDPEALARLVAACRGCHDAALAHGAPFVSGKDSLYNEFVGPDGRPDPVTPTLVITALGIVPDVAAVPLTGVVAAGDDVWLVGPVTGALGASHLDEVLGGDHGGPVAAPDPSAADRHRQLHTAILAGLVRSAHDLSEGGLAVAAAEWALGGRLGLQLGRPDSGAPPPPDAPDVPAGASDRHEVEAQVRLDPVGALFGEGAGRYLVEVDPLDRRRFAELVPSATRIGTITAEPVLEIGSALAVSLDDVALAFTAAQHVTLQPQQAGRGATP
jgi:phosphoribosylformylglycinamidine synthase